MKTRFLSVCLALFVFFGAASLHAGHNSVFDQNTGSVYTDLQTAIDAANPGDTLEVSGFFVGSFTITKNLNLIGKHDATLDGGGVATVLTTATPLGVLVPVSVTLDKLTIQNGASLTGGAGILNPSAILVIKNSEIINNQTLGSGGGILNGTALVLGDPGLPLGNPATLTLINSKVANNNASEAGGGIVNLFGILEIINSQISRNQAVIVGGGIYSFEGTNTITSSKIDGNAAFLQGGGLANTSGSITTLKHVKVKVNSSAFGAGIYNGTGLEGVSGSTLTIIYSKIAENAAFDEGGGLFNDSNSITTFNHSKVKKNLSGGPGGGVFNNIDGVLNIDAETKFEKNQPDNIFNA